MWPVQPKTTDPSGLLAAAEALDAELRRFELLADAIGREHLNSEKNVKRAGQRLQELVECHSRLSAQVQSLIGALDHVRTRQEAQALAVSERANEIRARAEILGNLVGQFETLRAEAAQLTAPLQQLAATGTEATVDQKRVALAGALDAIDVQLHAVAARTDGLVEAATAEHFLDLARHAESLRTQLQSTRNKIILLRRSLGGSVH